MPTSPPLRNPTRKEGAPALGVARRDRFQRLHIPLHLGSDFVLSYFQVVVADADERRNELLAKEEHRGKNLQVTKAPYPVDPRKPPRRRKNR